MKQIRILLLPAVVLLLTGQAKAQLKKAPADVAAAMLIKVADFEKNISDGRSVGIYVMGAPEVAAELRKGVGKPIGKGTLGRVDAGNGLPSGRPDILFVGSASGVVSALEYTRKNRVLSATGSPDLVERGITLGFGIGEDDKPKILLNSKSSAAEGVDWNPAILKIAKIQT
jgi:hypothetical protein